MSDSRSLPLYVGLGVLALAGLLLVGRNLWTGGDSAAPADANPNTSVDPTHPQRLAAREAIRSGNLEDAVAALRQVSPDDPGYLAAQADLAVIQERSGDTDEALQTTERILGIRSDVHDAHFVRCRVFYRLERLREAELECLRALELIPDQIKTRTSLGLVRIAQGRLQDGIDTYYRALTRGEQADALDALRDLNDLETRRPELAEVQYALAFLAGTLGSHDEERMRLEKYLDLAPEGTAAPQARAKLTELGG